eukprot:31231-Pelagococcus_subviridis.AAC.11
MIARDVPASHEVTATKVPTAVSFSASFIASLGTASARRLWKASSSPPRNVDVDDVVASSARAPQKDYSSRPTATTPLRAAARRRAEATTARRSASSSPPPPPSVARASWRTRTSGRSSAPSRVGR